MVPLPLYGSIEDAGSNSSLMMSKQFLSQLCDAAIPIVSFCAQTSVVALSNFFFFQKIPSQYKAKKKFKNFKKKISWRSKI